MSSRLVSRVCKSPTGSSLPFRPCSGVLPELLATPLATVSPMVTQWRRYERQRMGVVRPNRGKIEGNAENGLDHS